MARDCRACQDLRTDAAEFYANGVTDTVRASLMNDTGLNPSLDPQHGDCEDLQKVIDCYVGNATAEVDGYDVCEWKDYMKAFLPKLYDTHDAEVATLCGILEKLKSLGDLCKMISALYPQRVTEKGTYNNELGDIQTDGSGNKMLIPIPAYADRCSVGIQFIDTDFTNCEDDSRKAVIRIAPLIKWVKFNESVSEFNNDDVLWSAKRTEVQNKIKTFLKFPSVFNAFWSAYSYPSSFTWVYQAQGQPYLPKFRMTAVDGYLQIQYAGFVGVGDVHGGIIGELQEPLRTHIYTITD